MLQRRVRKVSSLGEFIRGARKRAGLTQDQLCKKANVGRPWLIRIEKGNHQNPQMAKVLDVLEALDAEFVVRPRQRFNRRELIKAAKRLVSD